MVVCDGFTTDEVVMLRFLEICIPSLDPESFCNVRDACSALELSRARLDKGSTLKCLKHIFGDDYEEPATPSGRNLL